MRRFLFHTGAHISFVLLVCLCVLWLRGNWTRDVLTIYSGPQDRRGIDVGGSSLTLWQEHTGWPMNPIPWMQLVVHHVDFRQPMIGGRAPAWSALGFEFGRYERQRSSQRLAWFRVPLWFVALLLSVLPLLRVRARIRLDRAIHRAASGQCPHCGYDLRATRSNTCSECGKPRWLQA